MSENGIRRTRGPIGAACKALLSTPDLLLSSIGEARDFFLWEFMSTLAEALGFFESWLLPASSLPSPNYIMKTCFRPLPSPSRLLLTFPGDISREWGCDRQGGECSFWMNSRTAN